MLARTLCECNQVRASASTCSSFLLIMCTRCQKLKCKVIVWVMQAVPTGMGGRTNNPSG